MSEMDELLPAKEVAIREFNSLRGRLCTVIESIGLPKKQERNLVLLIKNLSYQNQAVVTEVIEKQEEALAQAEYDAWGIGSNESALKFRYTKDKLETQ